MTFPPHEPLEQEPRFYIEPTDSDDLPELSRVIAFRRAMRMRAPTCRVVAIPNAGKRGQAAINQAKAEGAVWGACDMLVIGPNGRVAWLEWKSGKGKVSSHQVSFLNWLRANGHDGAVFRTADAAIEWLIRRGFPVEKVAG